VKVESLVRLFISI